MKTTPCKLEARLIDAYAAVDEATEAVETATETLHGAKAALDSCRNEKTATESARLKSEGLNVDAQKAAINHLCACEVQAVTEADADVRTANRSLAKAASEQELCRALLRVMECQVGLRRQKRDLH